jgi:hypothetical protein
VKVKVTRRHAARSDSWESDSVEVSERSLDEVEERATAVLRQE